MKKLLLLLVTVAMLASFAAGCGEDGPDISKPTDKTTLTLWEISKPVLDLAIMDYEIVNPDVVVEIEAMPESSGNMLTALKMAIGAGTAPDMLNTPSDYVWAMGSAGYLQDLSNFGASDVKDLFTDYIWKVANADPDHIYTLPFDANVINFAYNADIIEDLGVSAPTTIDDVRNIGDKLQARYGTESDMYVYAGAYNPEFYGTSFQMKDFVCLHYFWYLWRMGGDIFNADYTECTINSDAAVEALQLMVDMKDDGYFTPNHPSEDFAAGKAVMYNDATPFIFENMKSANFEIKMALQPVLKEGVAPYTSMGLYCYAVTSESKNAQAAYDFLEFLCTDVDYQIDYCKPSYFIPSLKEAVASAYFKTDEWQIVLEQLSHSKATPGIENWQEMDMFIYEAIQSALDGRTSAKVALDTAKNNIDALIKK